MTVDEPEVKMEEESSVAQAVKPPMAPTNENESSVVPKVKEEDRVDSTTIKREDITGEKRDVAVSGSVGPTLKKKSSPSQHPRQKPMMNHGMSAINSKNPMARFNPMNHPPSIHGHRGPFPIGRGYGAPPPYGFPGSGSFHGHPHPHAYPPPHMMQHFNMASNGQYSMKGPNYHPAMAAGYGGGSGPYGMPAPFPPQHHSMNPNFGLGQMNTSSDSNSISSMNSHNSKKKRTIDGMHPVGNTSSMGFNPYPFRRAEDSNSSTTSTLTAGNNTSNENMDDDSKNPSKNASMVFRPKNGGRPESRTHHRSNSGSSTASSLSVGGCSLSSYGEVRGKQYENNAAICVSNCWISGDSIMTDANGNKKSPKRQKKSGLMVDTAPSLLQPLEQDQSSRFEQLSLGAKPPTSTDSSSGTGNSNLFLSLSTSPINATDVDATPNMKNTKEERTEKKTSIYTAEEKDRPSETPTPPVHGELGDSEILNDEHSMLHRHLRGQTFTPLPHMSERNVPEAASPSNTTAALQHQLSWSITGDTPSLGDLDEWDESIDKPLKADSMKSRPGSATSADSRTMADFHLWKEEHDQMIERGVSGTTTPLPVFFEQSGDNGSENRFGDTNKASRRHDDSQSSQEGRKSDQSFWKSEGLPPTPMFINSEFRDDVFPGHSPMQGDRREHVDSFNVPPYPPHGGDRIRNLRGRVPPGNHLPPMPLHIPPHMSSHHLPLTSPMGLGPSKAGLWSPHGISHMNSPHGIGSPISNMAQSKRKCIPLKPPIPSKYQGDMEKFKNAPVPEFTSLVNYPSHMSQKQAVNLPDGMRCCVMCGQACPCSSGNKSKKNKAKASEGLAPRSSNGQDHMGEKGGGFAIIPTQNKGLCTLCDVNVWVVSSTGLEIKWCKGCKNFRPWAAFGDKGLATKCLRCRERQREKYALQKEEKEKARLVAKSKSK